jgi:hypothetical protein
VEPTDREVALAGVIRQIHGFGPPGYGEDKKHDARIVYWVMDLPINVNVVCVPERPEWALIDCKSTKQLRLFLPVPPDGKELEARLRTMQGKKAIVTGLLHRRDTMGEITPIYMDVTAIAPVQTTHSH